MYNQNNNNGSISVVVTIDFITGAPKATISSTETSPTNKSPILIKVQFDRM